MGWFSKQEELKTEQPAPEVKAPPPPWTEEIGVAEGMRPFEARAIACVFESLRERPKEWTFDHFYAKHEAFGIRVWIANETYGLWVEVGKAKLEAKKPGGSYGDHYTWGDQLRALFDEVALNNFVECFEQHKLQIAASRPTEVTFEPVEGDEGC